jgi:undecaprenyl-diphosphatase
VSVLAQVLASDDRLLDRLVGWRTPRWLRLWMIAATRLGDGWLLAVGALVYPLADDHGRRVIGAAFVAAALASALLVCVKGRVRRPRPCDRTPGFDVESIAWFPSDRFSFPSGHALNAFALASVLALSYPFAAAPMLAIAASVAASRVVLGLHWLSDVVAGALGGLLIGGLVWTVLLHSL